MSARGTLVVAILGSSMAFIDGTVVGVALPVMQRELAMTVGAAQWVVEAYLLLLASFVLVGGVLGDRLGRRRVFLAGVVSFAVASAACGLAPSPWPLVVARAFQGIGAALLVPGSLSLLTAAYPDDKSRGAAIGTWSASSSIMSAAGPVAGGWVVAHASWRWLFFFNVPVAVACVVLARAHVAESRDDDAARTKLDVVGAALATSGLGVVVYALVRAGAGEGGVLDAGATALLTVGVALLAVFVVVEARSRAPMVPLALFRSRTFSGTNLLTLLLYGALSVGLFFVPFDLIQVQHYSPTAAGAALLPIVLLISVMSRWAGALAGRIGARTPLVVGPAIAAVGFLLMAVPAIDDGRSYWTTFFPGMTVLGLGMGVTVAPLTAAVMGSVERSHAGVASGINNAVSRAAGLLAVAALGLLLVARFDATLDRELARLSLPAATAAAMHAERGKLAAAELPADLAPPMRDALRRALDVSYVAGFRTLMVACAALAALSAVAAGLLVAGRPAPRSGQPREGKSPASAIQIQP